MFMPSRQKKLADILLPEFGTGVYMRATRDEYENSCFHDEITRVFQELGGTLDIYPIAFRGFDIQLNGFIVELDEEQHFNRYRSTTLRSTWCRAHEMLDYLDYCTGFEHNCLLRARYG